MSLFNILGILFCTYIFHHTTGCTLLFFQTPMNSKLSQTNIHVTLQFFSSVKLMHQFYTYFMVEIAIL